MDTQNVAIKIEGLGKSYRLGQPKSGDLRSSISQKFKNFFLNNEQNIFWALKDVSFDVERGKAIGIVGKNGAGKSTLLKILSRITYPTNGGFELFGRVSSLLEVGTGFHPELSGRENIFLNGTILGMKRKEIKSKLDEIIDFSGVETFLDTPVKHYSSGMTVRLAFAVAAHLDPEILIVDEVLAVGDAEFQKKCLGKMSEVTKSEGRTVLFVSHNMNAIKSLCDEAVLLDKGGITMSGSSGDVVTTYMSEVMEACTKKIWDINHPGDEFARLLMARVVDSNGTDLAYIENTINFFVEIEYEVLKEGNYPIPNIHVFTEDGIRVLVSSPPKHDVDFRKGINRLRVEVPSNLLNVGKYSLHVALSSMNPVIVHAFAEHALNFEVNEDLTSRESDFRGTIPGVIRPSLNWSPK